MRWRRAAFGDRIALLAVLWICCWTFAVCSPRIPPTLFRHEDDKLKAPSSTLPSRSVAARFDPRMASLCPEGCECVGTVDRHVSKVVCLNSGLTSLPKENFSSVIVNLTIRGNPLAQLYDGDFASTKDLTTLVLSDNSIRSIQPSTFHDLDRLTLLDLSGNRLELLPSGVFHTLRSLRLLNVSGNSVSKLENDTFRSLAQLDVLDLSRNSIGFADLDAFSGLDSLSVLDLAYNRISSLRLKAFSTGVFRLRAVFLQHNELLTVEADTFRALSFLSVLSLSHNRIERLDEQAFVGLRYLEELSLRGNRLTTLVPERFTYHLPHLVRLDVGENYFNVINASQFSPGKRLRSLDFGGSTMLTSLLPNAFLALPELKKVNFSNCENLSYISPHSFRKTPSVQILDLSGCGLETLNGKFLLSFLPHLEYLNLERNRWNCDCGLRWISSLLQERPNLTVSSVGDVTCSGPLVSINKSIFNRSTYNGNCSSAAVVHYNPNMSFRVGSTALLECQVSGTPRPAVTWYTPKNHVLHRYADAYAQYASAHPVFHTKDGYAIQQPLASRMKVLKNGNLFISPVEIMDAGIYTCMADNALGNQSVHIGLTLDYEILMHVKVVSILVGLATSVAFMLVMLVAQLVHMLLNRWGWCCCRPSLPPKAKQVRKILESIEHYKTQQLDRLRDNYNLQVQKIKDNCTQQMEKLRDSYASQTDRFKDIRDYGTLQIDRIREQYYEQVRRVRDYSVQQMNKVRENYVFQRNRIRKFSAHQLFKLRENYKVQQMHLNKILENLNLESCRTVCARTDSIMFTSEITMDAVFPPDMNSLPIPSMSLDGSDSSGSVGLPALPDLEVGDILLPAELEEFEMQTLAAIARGEKHKSGDRKRATLAPLIAPVFLDLPPILEREDTVRDSSSLSSDGHQQELEVKAEVELDEIATRIVDPNGSFKNSPDTVSV